jgi:putative glutamine amidotransferase
MPRLPLVAVTADVGEERAYRWHEAEETYLRAVAVGARAIPLIVPSLSSLVEVDEVLSRVDGLLVTGAKSNVHPARYGAPAQETSGPFDEARDATSLAFIRGALDRGLPMLAICRGMQELNVALGGSLVGEVQDLPGRMDHRAPRGEEDNDRRFALRHDVRLVTGGWLAGVLGAGSIKVNSLHRQAVDRLAPGLIVEATAEDGTIEAVRVADARDFALGVQWHPEYWVTSDAPSARLFAAFGDAVRAHAAGATAKAAELAGAG